MQRSHLLFRKLGLLLSTLEILLHHDQLPGNLRSIATQVMPKAKTQKKEGGQKGVGNIFMRAKKIDCADNKRESEKFYLNFFFKHINSSFVVFELLYSILLLSFSSFKKKKLLVPFSKIINPHLKIFLFLSLSLEIEFYFSIFFGTIF